MHLDDEQRTVGKENFTTAVGASRRDFLKAAITAGVVPGATLGAMYFGYDKVTKPLRVGVIGTGDEGQVLIGACNPDYVQIVALADIRPSAIRRAFYGDYKSNGDPVPPRPGILKVYAKQHGWKSMDEAKQKLIKVYEDYHELLEDDQVEAVIIALPLHLHAQASIEAMKAGKHVLTEKLMAHSVKQCKDMAVAADDLDKVMAVGHQRHYNVLYENAVHLIQNVFLGELHSIRAQWHRNNLPGGDSWSVPVPGGEPDYRGKGYDKIAGQLRWLDSKLREAEAVGKDAERIHNLKMAIEQWKAMVAEAELKAADFGYEGFKLGDVRDVPGLEELVRWRLFDRTGGGIMAELGSHQLDAASIFISALKNKGKPRHKWDMVHPLTVHAVGGRHVFPYDRDIGDHVYCMLEFPAPGYDPAASENADDRKRKEMAIKRFGYYDNISGQPTDGIPGFDKDYAKRIVYMYSSINGCGFGGYGEVVMGTKRTMVIEKEQETMLFNNRDTASKLSVTDDAGGAVIDTQASGPAVAVAQAATGPVSRGYKEEIEHWAYCIRNRDPENVPRCNPKVALGDAVVALTTTLAVRRANRIKRGEQQVAGFVEFKDEWFDPKNPATPEKELGMTLRST